MPKDETENIMHLAFLLGSETIEKVSNQKLTQEKITRSFRKNIWSKI